MIFVTLITIIPMVWFYNRTGIGEGAAGSVATIYGRSVPLAVAQKASRRGELCMQLAQMEMYQPTGDHVMTDLYQSLAVTRQDAKENFVWNSMVLRHEAEQLGVSATDDEVFEATKAMPAFLNNGAFDSQRYTAYAQNVLPHLGFTTDDLNDLIADSLRLKKIKALLGSTVAPVDSEIRDAFTRLNQKTEASVVRFKFDDFLSAVQVSDEDLKKRFEESKATLKTDELRKVKYVAFALPPGQKLEGPARAEALSKLQKQAEDFTVAMTEKDAKFEDVAAKQGATVQVTPEFSMVKPPEVFQSSTDIVQAVFKLNQQDPNSDVLETQNGYYVLQLAGITQPRPLTFDEAKAALADTMKHERAQEALNLKATEVRNKIETELKGGKTFAAAAEANGVKAEDFPAFSPKEPKVEPANSGEIMQTASELNEGQLSTVVPTSDGSVIVYVTKRLPIDETKLKADRNQLADALGNAQRASLFQQWLRLRRAAAQLQTSFRG